MIQIKKKLKTFISLFLLLFVLSISHPSFAEFREVATPETITTQIVKPADTAIPYAISGESLVNLISNMVDFEVIGASIVFNRFTGQLVIKNTPSNLSRIEQILYKLRKSALRQVEIEAKIITVTSDDIDALGLQALDLDTTSFFKGEKGTFTTGTVGSNEITFPDVLDRDSTTRILGQEYSLGLLSERVDADILIDSLKSDAEVNTLSSPKITVFNNQRAHIKIATYTSFVSEVDGDLETSGDIIFFTVETISRRAPAGTILDVTPTINNDGTLTLTLHPSFVRADLTAAETIPTIIQSTDNVGATLGENTIILPEFTTQSVDTTIVIPDGGTAVLGGLIDEIETNTIDKIPVIGDIPYLGNLFKKEKKQNEKSHLIIFIKATSKYVDENGKIRR